MRPTHTLYRIAQEAARALVPVVARGDSKVARGLRARRDAHELLARWGFSERDTTHPGIWLHAPSVGEGLQARAVLEAVKERHPDLQVVFTHFSPSAERLARNMPADVSGYLPWDLRAPMQRVLDAVRPDAVVFAKTEVWPVLVEEASRRKIPALLVGGTLAPGAGRLRWPAREFLRDTWRSLARVAAITPEDAERFVALGVATERVTVTGDPSVDSAATRARAADPSAAWLAPFHADARPTVLAGSTWPPDEGLLLPALAWLRARVPEVRVVLAPHEPTEGHVRELLALLAAEGWRACALAEVERAGSAEGVDAVVVDRVGVLAHLYTVGTVAYVGGGFHRAGLHSVLEPAAAGLPVCFGPIHANAREAGDLGDALGTWLTDAAALDYSARRALGYIDSHLGAAARTAALLDDLLEPSGR